MFIKFLKNCQNLNMLNLGAEMERGGGGGDKQIQIKKTNIFFSNLRNLKNSNGEHSSITTYQFICSSLHSYNVSFNYTTKNSGRGAITQYILLCM